MGYVNIARKYTPVWLFCIAVGKAISPKTLTCILPLQKSVIGK
jgi:hypothetical protein